MTITKVVKKQSVEQMFMKFAWLLVLLAAINVEIHSISTWNNVVIMLNF